MPTWHCQPEPPQRERGGERGGAQKHIKNFLVWPHAIPTPLTPSWRVELQYTAIAQME
jgi:hypothetical protein